MYAQSIMAVHADGQLYLIGPTADFPYGMAAAQPPFERTIRAIAEQAPQLAQLRARLSEIGTSPLDMATWLTGQVSRGRITIVPIPALATMAAPVGPGTALFEMPDVFAGPPPPRSHPRIDVKNLPAASKITEMILRSVPYLPSGTRRLVLSMISPESLKMMAATMLVWGASHAVGIGAIVDVALLGVGYALVGWSAFEGLATILQASQKAMRAEASDDLDAAAEAFAGGLLLLGINTLMLMMMRSGSKGSVAGAGLDAAAVARWQLYLQELPMHFDGSKAALWTGLEGGQKLAEALAVFDGKITLEMVLSKTDFFTRYRMEFGKAQTATTARIWQMVSEKYAAQLRGNVTVYLNRGKFLMTSVDRLDKALAAGVSFEEAQMLLPQIGAELFIFLDRPAVTGITFIDVTNPNASSILAGDALKAARSLGRRSAR